MQYRILHEQDLPALEGFLSTHSSSTMFLRNNLRAAGMGRRSHPLSADYYAAINAKGAICAVIAHMRAGNILVQGGGDGILSVGVGAGTDTGVSNDALANAQSLPAIDPPMAALAAFCQSRLDGRITGVLGPSAAVQIVQHAFGLQSDGFTINHDETLYSLSLSDLQLPIHPLGDSYQVEDAARMDRATLLRWMRQYEIEALGAEETPALDGRVASRVVNALEDRCWWVLFVDGQPVSLTGFNARLPDAVQVGPVWTPPAYRNMGYARFLVGRSLLAARARGVKQAVLFANNPAACRAYEALGFTAIGQYRLSQLRKPVVLADQLPAM
ncbi:GNAT family N-acetyltransferase [Thalassospira marina]|nr:GNAT family N-acetyltransferase [Thalassospira marina]